MMSRHRRKQEQLFAILTEVCRSGDIVKLTTLLEQDSSILDVRDAAGRTCLHYCCEHDHIETAHLILSKRPDLLTLQDDDGYTVLHLTAISGNSSLLRFLLAEGQRLLTADVFKSLINTYDNENHTALHWSTVSGEVECLILLHSCGADIKLPDVHGAHPIHYACQGDVNKSKSRKSLQILKEILLNEKDERDTRDNDGRSPLIWSASSGNSEGILTLLTAGADVTLQDKDGLTALHCAASRGHLNCIETLLTFGGTPIDQTDCNGCTPLFYAVTLGHADCTRCLLQSGAFVNHQDRKGRSCGHCGAAKGQLETLKLIAQAGGNLWLRNIRGDLPIHEAIKSGRREVVIFLMEMLTDNIDLTNTIGKSPLHVACFNNDIEMCKLLIDFGIELNSVMKQKGLLITPLDVCLQKGYRSCAKFLLLHGALPASKISDPQRLPLRKLILNDSTSSCNCSPGELNDAYNHHRRDSFNGPLIPSQSESSQSLDQVRLPSRINPLKVPSRVSQRVQVFTDVPGTPCTCVSTATDSETRPHTMITNVYVTSHQPMTKKKLLKKIKRKGRTRFNGALATPGPLAIENASAADIWRPETDDSASLQSDNINGSLEGDHTYLVHSEILQSSERLIAESTALAIADVASSVHNQSNGADNNDHASELEHAERELTAPIEQEEEEEEEEGEQVTDESVNNNAPNDETRGEEINGLNETVNKQQQQQEEDSQRGQAQVNDTQESINVNSETSELVQEKQSNMLCEGKEEEEEEDNSSEKIEISSNASACESNERLKRSTVTQDPAQETEEAEQLNGQSVPQVESADGTKCNPQEESKEETTGIDSSHVDAGTHVHLDVNNNDESEVDREGEGQEEEKKVSTDDVNQMDRVKSNSTRGRWQRRESIVPVTVTDNKAVAFDTDLSIDAASDTASSCASVIVKDDRSTQITSDCDQLVINLKNGEKIRAKTLIEVEGQEIDSVEYTKTAKSARRRGRTLSKCNHRLHRKQSLTNVKPLDLKHVKAKVDSRPPDTLHTRKSPAVIGDSGCKNFSRSAMTAHEMSSIAHDITLSSKKYATEKKIFEELQELKRCQMKANRAHECILVRRLSDRFNSQMVYPGVDYYSGDFDFKSYERFLYDQLRQLSSSNQQKLRASSEDNLSCTQVDEGLLGHKSFSAEILISKPNDFYSHNEYSFSRFIDFTEKKGEFAGKSFENSKKVASESFTVPVALEVSQEQSTDTQQQQQQQEPQVKSYKRVLSDVVKIENSLDYGIITRSASRMSDGTTHRIKTSVEHTSLVQEQLQPPVTTAALASCSSSSIKGQSKQSKLVNKVNPRKTYPNRSTAKCDQVKSLNPPQKRACSKLLYNQDDSSLRGKRGNSITRLQKRRYKSNIPPPTKINISSEEISKRWHCIKEQERQRRKSDSHAAVTYLYEVNGRRLSTHSLSAGNHCCAPRPVSRTLSESDMQSVHFGCC